MHNLVTKLFQICRSVKAGLDGARNKWGLKELFFFRTQLRTDSHRSYVKMYVARMC